MTGRALRHVCQPAAAVATHRRHGLAAHHEHPPVAAALQVAADEALQIPNLLHRLRSRQIAGAAHQAHTLALRAEQRFAHQRALACLALHPGLRLAQFAAHPGVRRGDPGAAQAQRGQALVHRAFDGPPVVVDRNAEIAQRVQHVQVEHHLCQGAAGHPAYEHRIRRPVLEARQDHRVGRIQGQRGGAQRHESAAHAAFGERALQLAAVPARVVGNDGHPQAHKATPNDSPSRRMSIAPARNDRPDCSALTVTCAGLNSMGSILKKS